MLASYRLHCVGLVNCRFGSLFGFPGLHVLVLNYLFLESFLLVISEVRRQLPIAEDDNNRPQSQVDKHNLKSKLALNSLPPQIKSTSTWPVWLDDVLKVEKYLRPTLTGTEQKKTSGTEWIFKKLFESHGKLWEGFDFFLLFVNICYTLGKREIDITWFDRTLLKQSVGLSGDFGTTLKC